MWIKQEESGLCSKRIEKKKEGKKDGVERLPPLDFSPPSLYNAMTSGG
jgi:hypothetical protein